MIEMPSKVSLIIVMGLPGAGKTKLCQDLVSSLQADTTQIMHICFDDFLPEQGQLNFNLEFNSDKWRKSRRNIHEKVESILKAVKKNGNELDVQEFRVSRAADNFILLLDDNFYYKSMRYEYYKLGKQYETGFFEIFLNCDLDVALLQNLKRDQVIPEEIIVKMREKFENPFDNNEMWEKSVFEVHEANKKSVDLLGPMITGSLLVPLETNTSNEIAVLESRRRCRQNIIHQSDLILRKLISIKMKSENNSLVKKELYSKLSKCKDKVMNDLSNGKIFSLDNEVIDTDDDKERLRDFILVHFESVLLEIT